MDPRNGWDIVGQNPETTEADLNDAIAEIRAAKAARAAKIREGEPSVSEPEPEPEQGLAGGPDCAEQWKREFVSEVGEGHASKTMQLVKAILALPADSSIIIELGLQSLRAELSDHRCTPPQRNRALRDWLQQSANRQQARWDELTSRWDELGFPSPPPPPPSPSCCVIFDFDGTLATCDVGWQHMEDPASRAFGGWERVALLRHMLERLAALGAQVSILSFNSSHTIRKTLDKLDLLSLIRGEHAGRTDQDCVIGCEDYNRHTATSKRAAAVAGKGEISKSTEINSRWMVTTTEESLPSDSVLSSSSQNSGQRVASDRILFVDDDPNNIEDVRTNCVGAAVLHVAATKGMTEQDVQSVLDWAAKTVNRSIDESR